MQSTVRTGAPVVISTIAGAILLLEPSGKFISPVWGGVRDLFAFAAPFQVNAAGGLLLATTLLHALACKFKFSALTLAVTAVLMGLVWTSLGGVALRVGLTSAQTSSTAAAIFLYFAVLAFRGAIAAWRTRHDSR